MIDFSARETHFVDHLTPIWRALPDGQRGRFWVSETAAGHARRLGLPVTVGIPEKVPTPIVTASWGDFRLVRSHPRPVVLCEHGAGQSYVGRHHPSYVGGRGREKAALFVVPNEQAAARSRAAYPRIPVAVVGSPRVDHLAATVPTPAGPVTAAVSFHWRCRIVPETDTAFDHYRPVLAATRAELAAAGISLVGHAHPRLLREATPVFEAAGIEVVADFGEVARRASVLAVDNSSVLFEFAALDRPVVVMNSPKYRRKVRHGLRFWDEAGIGLGVDEPEMLAAAILAALADPPEQQTARRASVERVYPVRGDAAVVATDAILATTVDLEVVA